jgi:hypothetical protein
VVIFKKKVFFSVAMLLRTVLRLSSKSRPQLQGGGYAKRELRRGTRELRRGERRVGIDLQSYVAAPEGQPGLAMAVLPFSYSLVNFT